MEKPLAKSIQKHITNHLNAGDGDFILKKSLPAVPLSGFHQWADGRDFVGGALVANKEGLAYWLLFLLWNDNNGFYMVVFPEDKSGPIAEIHTVTEAEEEICLQWQYAPRKRDKKNQERKKYFSHYFGDIVVNLSVPLQQPEVEGFLEEIFTLAETRLKADKLDQAPPAFRDSFPEGKVREKMHRYRERDSAVTRLAKQLELERSGKLQCKCCRFDFDNTYGEIGTGFIEAHHTVPVSHLHKDGGKTKVEDIALVCSNCHRMLHRRRPWLSMAALSKIISL